MSDAHFKLKYHNTNELFVINFAIHMITTYSLNFLPTISQNKYLITCQKSQFYKNHEPCTFDLPPFFISVHTTWY